MYQRPSRWTTGEIVAAVVLIAGLIAVCTALSMLWNQNLYGDWRCAFAQCRLEK